MEVVYCTGRRSRSQSVLSFGVHKASDRNTNCTVNKEFSRGRSCFALRGVVLHVSLLHHRAIGNRMPPGVCL